MLKNIKNVKMLNVGKTEMILFNPGKKPLDYQLKLKLNGKRLYHTSSVKYLGTRQSIS